MADPTMDRLRQLSSRGSDVGGGFYNEVGGSPAMPFRPSGQDVAALPPAQDNFYAVPHEGPRRSHQFVDQVDNGYARLVDDAGTAHMEHAEPSYREGHMTDGSVPADTGGDALRARLGAQDDGQIIRLGEML